MKNLKTFMMLFFVISALTVVMVSNTTAATTGATTSVGINPMATESLDCITAQAVTTVTNMDDANSILINDTGQQQILNSGVTNVETKVEGTPPLDVLKASFTNNSGSLKLNIDMNLTTAFDQTFVH